MERCPITYDSVSDRRYSSAGLKLLSRRLTELHDLPWTPDELRREAIARATKMSIQGHQPKLSASLNVRQNRFDIVDKGGVYILKPPLQDYPEVPENEDVTMRMAKAAGIEVPLHGLIYTRDGALCYFIRRFDRVGRGDKRAVEDFAQLLGHTRDTKYDSSLEQAAGAVDTYCTFPAIDRVKLFRRVLFGFICGNEDMHLKNFSIIVRDNKVELSPAYDLLNTTIALPNPQEEMALPVAGKKSNIRKETLLDDFAKDRLDLTDRSVENVINDLQSARPVWDDLLDRSFLSADMKAAYRDVVAERWSRLDL